MNKFLSGLSEKSLSDFLNRFRVISAMNDADALIETDKLILDIFDGEFESDEDIQDNSSQEDIDYEDISELRMNIKDLEQKLSKKLKVTGLDAYNLKSDANMLLDKWYGKVKSIYYDEVRSIVEEAYQLSKRVQKQAYVLEIEKTKTQHIPSISSVRSIIKKLDSVAEYFTNYYELTDEIRQSIRESKERAAWARANKKLGDAKVAQAGGKQSKVDSLKKEASVLLAQDWALVFPGETPPSSP